MIYSRITIFRLSFYKTIIPLINKNNSKNIKKNKNFFTFFGKLFHSLLFTLSLRKLSNIIIIIILNLFMLHVILSSPFLFVFHCYLHFSFFYCASSYFYFLYNYIFCCNLIYMLFEISFCLDENCQL